MAEINLDSQPNGKGSRHQGLDRHHPRSEPGRQVWTTWHTEWSGLLSGRESRYGLRERGTLMIMPCRKLPTAGVNNGRLVSLVYVDAAEPEPVRHCKLKRGLTDRTHVDGY